MPSCSTIRSLASSPPSAAWISTTKVSIFLSSVGPTGVEPALLLAPSQAAYHQALGPVALVGLEPTTSSSSTRQLCQIGLQRHGGTGGIRPRSERLMRAPSIHLGRAMGAGVGLAPTCSGLWGRRGSCSSIPHALGQTRTAVSAFGELLPIRWTTSADGGPCQTRTGTTAFVGLHGIQFHQGTKKALPEGLEPPVSGVEDRHFVR